MNSQTCQPLAAADFRNRANLTLGRVLWMLFLLWCCSVAGGLQAQDETRNYRKPILTVETGGHHSRVRSLLWQNEATLLSGGEDKVVKVWDLAGRPRLARSVRPPIWRGPRGAIFALAATKLDGRGQSLLAVGGFGVEASAGDLTVFRFPGVERVSTGEVVARLLPPQRLLPGEIGHAGSVQCLDFDRDGKTLASGGNDGSTRHQTLILWDRVGDSFRPRVALGERERIGEIRDLAFSPDGTLLATGGADGALRIWNVAQGTQVVVSPPRAPDPINTLAFDPTGPAIVVGHEGGGLFRYDLTNPARPVGGNLGTRPEQGPVESLAYSPDGRFLAVAIKGDRADAINPMTFACDLEIRGMPGGGILQQRKVAGLVYAMAFSPQGSRFAYSGGTAQEIYVHDTANLDLQRPAARLQGEGSTPFDLGFSRDSQVVGFTRQAFEPVQPPPPVYEAFDLGRRQTRNIRRADLTFAQPTYNGWALAGSINRYVLELVSPQGLRLPLDINRKSERNWWSWTFVPPAPDHPRPTLAVGCESGVIFYDLQSGQRTRTFAGHSSPVVSLVPSPDGRWLASSSLDQTIMIYRLSGCDTRPGLGASFRLRPDRTWEVARIDPGGFAEAMGLKAGETIARAGVQRTGIAAKFHETTEQIAEFVASVDQLVPHLDQIAIWVNRTIPVPPIGIVDVPVIMGTTKRNNPTLTLMLGVDKEWVLWTPSGYYDSSIEGDSRYVGWHLNADYRATSPSDFVPISAHAKSMLRPNVLQKIWETGDPRPDPALVQRPHGAPPPDREPRENAPPKITFEPIPGGIPLPSPGGIWPLKVRDPKLIVNIHADGGSRIASRRVILDERKLDLPQLAEPRERMIEQIALELAANRRIRLAVEAVNQAGVKRIQSIDMVYTPPAPPPAPEPRRLVILGVGINKTQDKRVPAIPFADRDAMELSRFLSDHLVSADGIRMTSKPKEDSTLLVADRASVDSIDAALNDLTARTRSQQLRSGDTVVLVIGAHVLQVDGEPAIAVANTAANRGKPPSPMLSAREVSERLGALTDYGCRVVVFLDGVHSPAPEDFVSTIKPWVRDLQLERGVITFVASREGPSQVDQNDQLGIFAKGVRDAVGRAVVANGPLNRPLTLEEFARAVRETVQDLSGRYQEGFCYIPGGVPPEILFAQP